MEGLISAIGGKWTTSRHLAEQVVDMALKKLQRSAKTETHCTPLFGGEIGRYKTFVERAVMRHTSISSDIVENLCRNYGSQYEAVLHTAQERPENGDALLKRILPDRPEIGAQVIHAVRHEMATHLSDVIFRRTGLGTLGDPGVEAINTIAGLMGRELNWDETTMAQEISTTRLVFETGHPARESLA